MKICIAQTKSLKGEVNKNIENHLRIIQRAINSNADLVIFPELSVTSYEPDLAKKLATTVDNIMFNPFQELSDKHTITIGIGMPTNGIDGINISLLIFQPNKKRLVYSKQMLHADELPYFVCGNNQVFLNIKQKKIAIGICYETLQAEHFLNAKKNGAEIYIASVAKPQGGIEKAFSHFPKIAQEFNTPILMANSVGYCDNFLSVGQSAIWTKKGELVAQLDQENQGMLIYDTELDVVETSQLKIEKGQLSELNELFQIYRNSKIKLEQNGIFQWTDNYPSNSIVENDLKYYQLKSGRLQIRTISPLTILKKYYSSYHFA
ncbi:MAG: carbon-nitrogen hydrolase family protein [Aureispira sp.]|nr:carbon-nitrogen hydrolase family protein [Aureispira sp.]